MSARSSVESAERKVDKCEGFLAMHTSAFERTKKQLVEVRTSRNQATEALKEARASLVTIKKAKKDAAKKKQAPKRITAPKAKNGSASKKAESASKLVKETEDKPSVCSVCHKAAVETPITVLRCGCKFHDACVVKWAKEGYKVCPTCLATNSFKSILGPQQHAKKK